MYTHTDINIQRMNLNNGDNQRKACFVMFRVDLDILLIVTIVEVHTLNLENYQNQTKFNAVVF